MKKNSLKINGYVKIPGADFFAKCGHPANMPMSYIGHSYDCWPDYGGYESGLKR